MAVPKKKISHSRGRKRRLEGKRNTDLLYQKSFKTGHFKKFHSLCPVSLHKNSGLKGLTLNNRFGTNTVTTTLPRHHVMEPGATGRAPGAPPPDRQEDRVLCAE